MNSLLEKLLKKRGIKNVDNLSFEEKSKFDQWQRVLSADEEITLERIAEFCRNQIGAIELKWSNLENAYDPRYVTQHVVYSNILKALQAPKQEREHLEKYLRSLVDE